MYSVKILNNHGEVEEFDSSVFSDIIKRINFTMKLWKEKDPLYKVWQWDGSHKIDVTLKIRGMIK